MTKKIFLYVSIFVIFILNIILDININNYIDILNSTEEKEQNNEEIK